MSKHEIDILFKNKLQDHQLTPSADAWEKLMQKRKPQKNSFRFVWMVAASVSLLVVSGWLWFNVSTSNQAPVLALTVDKQQPLLAQANGKVPATTESIVKTSSSKKEKTQVSTSVAKLEMPQAEERELSMNLSKLELMLNPILIAKIELKPITAEMQANIPVVEFSNEYPNLLAEEEEFEELTKMQALLALFKKDVKAPTFSLSDLREAKDELLAKNILFNPEKTKIYEY